MRFATTRAKLTVYVGLLLACAPAIPADTAQEKIIRQRAIELGLKTPEQMNLSTDRNLVAVGKVFFESENLSLNGRISCRTCHLDKFGSADGLANAVAIHGRGEGKSRARSDGKLLPRNTLAFWGRGGRGFETFFWDGKIDFSGSNKVSQFGTNPPSPDPLVTAVHLPVVEIREMLDEDDSVRSHMTEDVDKSRGIHRLIVEQLRQKESRAIAELARQIEKKDSDVEFLDVARAIAAFIRFEFRVKDTKFHRFVAKGEKLDREEIQGALIFYGKGKCIVCHSGPHFSDFKFHTIAFPQLGFGKNGFGVDYGRYNVTFNPSDLYKFRTAPLYNVARTAPYGHSGSVATLPEAILAHSDPLRLVDTTKMTPLDRHELYKRLALTTEEVALRTYLTDDEIAALVAFLRTLSF